MLPVPVSSSLQGAEEATASRPPSLQAAVQLKGKTLPRKERCMVPTAVRAPEDGAGTLITPGRATPQNLLGTMDHTGSPKPSRPLALSEISLWFPGQAGLPEKAHIDPCWPPLRTALSS